MECGEDIWWVGDRAPRQCLLRVEAGPTLDVGGVATEAATGVARWLAHAIFAAGLGHPVQIDVTEASVFGRAQVGGVEHEHRVVGVLLHYCLEVGVTQPDRESAGMRSWWRGDKGGGGTGTDVKPLVSDGVQAGSLGGGCRVLCPSLRVETPRAGDGLLGGDDSVEGAEGAELMSLAGETVGVGDEGRCVHAGLVLTPIACELSRAVRHAVCELSECCRGVKGYTLDRQQKGQRACPLASRSQEVLHRCGEGNLHALHDECHPGGGNRCWAEVRR